jgi:hypothetical protein
LKNFRGMVYYYYLPAAVGGFQRYRKKNADAAGFYEAFIFAAKSDAWIAILEKGNPCDRF